MRISLKKFDATKGKTVPGQRHDEPRITNWELSAEISELPEFDSIPVVFTIFNEDTGHEVEFALQNTVRENAAGEIGDILYWQYEQASESSATRGKRYAVRIFND